MKDYKEYRDFFGLFAGVTNDDLVAYAKCGKKIKKGEDGAKADIKNTTKPKTPKYPQKGDSAYWTWHKQRLDSIKNSKLESKPDSVKPTQTPLKRVKTRKVV